MEQLAYIKKVRDAVEYVLADLQTKMIEEMSIRKCMLPWYLHTIFAPLNKLIKFEQERHAILTGPEIGLNMKFFFDSFIDKFPKACCDVLKLEDIRDFHAGLSTFVTVVKEECNV